MKEKKREGRKGEAWLCLAFLLSLAVHAAANIKMWPFTATYQEFSILMPTIIVVALVGVAFDIMAKKIYKGVKPEYVLFWFGPLIVVLSVIFLPKVFTLPSLQIRLLMITAYLAGLIFVNFQYVSKKGFFREKDTDIL